MPFVHPVFFAVVTFVAVFLCHFFASLRASLPTGGKYRSIDGLRGYLALFVFFHHTVISYFYVMTGRWELPPSNLFVHLGQASVSFFFMITAFLFYGKVIEKKGGEMDWPWFFVGRIMRLAPLYVVAVMALMVITAFESHWILSDTPLHLLKSAVHWFLFTIFDAPSVNGVGVQLLMAGVNWSLPYEWYFYCSLPLLALFGRIKVSWVWLLISVATLAWAAHHGALGFYAAVFACGIGAAKAIRNPAFVKFSRSQVGSWLVVACLAMLVAAFDSAYDYPQLIILAIAFALIAGGADLFGILSAKASHVLGELAYSIYLLHGMLLFVTLKYVFGYDAIRSMSAFDYWAVIGVLTLVLLAVATFAFHFIEKPAMALTPKVMASLRRRRGVGLSAMRDPLFDNQHHDTNGPAF